MSQVNGVGGRPAILVEGLTKSFGEVHALRGIDLSVPRGTVLGVLGPKVDALRVPLPWNRRRLARTPDPDTGAWARLARGVMRRPVPVAVAVCVPAWVNPGASLS